MEPLSTAICFLLDKTQAALNHIFGTACKHLVQTLNYDILICSVYLINKFGIWINILSKAGKPCTYSVIHKSVVQTSIFTSITNLSHKLLGKIKFYEVTTFTLRRGGRMAK